ncbi:MAG: isopeptide-forming domain-containing fimbrial protein [Candidatus Eremiobacteraeota bacterium]|nr:isopeptide-forming domain-containing fimbrial protein [Candidatus Eremiobacteraeota bacterium]
MLCGLIAAQRVLAASSGGTSVVNAVSATYDDASGRAYQISSNPIVATIASLSAIVVSPKEPLANPNADGAAVGSTVTRTFLVTNTSNISDAYQIDKLVAGSLPIANVVWLVSGSVQKTGIGGSISPPVAPGASIAVRITISTAGLAVGASVPVTIEAHTTVTGTSNGLASDTGEEWIVGMMGPSLVGPGGPNTQVSKTVNQKTIVQSQPGTAVVFDITAKNAGGAPATNVTVNDPVPSGLAVDLSSATIDGAPAGGAATLSGQTIRFALPILAGGATIDVSFRASLPPGSTLGESFVNIASIAADGIPAQQTTPAEVFTGSANIVFDGYQGGSHPVSGATVSLLDASGAPVKLDTLASRALTTGAATTPSNNPYVTGSDGTYAFALSASAIPANGARFYLTIAAAGYLNRKIAIDLAPAQQSGFYNVTQTAQDGQPLAIAGGFTLTKSNVKLSDVFGLFGNLPVFVQNTIVVAKTVDRQAASAGDRLLFSIEFQNQTSAAFTDVSVVDTLPSGMSYLFGTAREDGEPLAPAVDGRTLTWTLAPLTASLSHTITYAATIFGDVAPSATLTNSVAVSGAGPGGARSGGSASASVTVIDGPFSSRRVVTGRVFLDDTQTGYFSVRDRVLPGVHVMLEDGSFAVTDAHGEFSIPAVRPGMHVLRIDPLTLPATARLRNDAPMGSPHALQRLLHGVLDDATMEDIEFAVEPTA